MKTTQNSNPVWKLLFLFVFLFSACVTSLEPWAPPSAFLADPQLNGCWQDDEGESWIFSHEDGTHWLTYTEEGQTARFQILTFSVDPSAGANDWKYFDLQPVLPQKGNGLERMHLLTTHGLMRYRLSGDALLLSIFDGEALETYLSKPGSPAHREVDNRLLLEASSEELWQLLKTIQHEDSLFDSSDSLFICQ
jgi:hypothetical protein